MARKAEPRPPGRPPISKHRSVAVHVRVPQPFYDGLEREANRRKITVSEVLRRRLGLG